MNKEILRFTLYAIIVYIFGDSLNSAVAELNIGEPRTVRLIYFLPTDWSYRADSVQEMKDGIRKVQTFYTEQMEAHGYGKVTFRVETDPQGEPMVHRVDGRHPDSYYLDNRSWPVIDEVGQMFDLDANIYFILAGRHVTVDGHVFGVRSSKNSGYLLLNSEVSWRILAHELGHAFGLLHDFRDNNYIMSYGSQNRLSVCAAEFLSVHPYFNPETPIEEGPPPIIKLISPRTYAADSKSIPIQLKVNHPDGIHQVFLHANIHANNRQTVKACRRLTGEKDAVVEFDYDGVIPSAHDPSYSTSFFNPLIHPILVEAVDIFGNLSREQFTLFPETLQPLTRILGDNQRGLPNAPLPLPFVVEVRDVDDGSGSQGVWVTFTVTAGGGTLSVERIMTNLQGRAESTLTLGPNLGINTVEVSAEGITVTFNAVAENITVSIPDPNLRAAIEKFLEKTPGTAITPAEMTTLTKFDANNASISDLTGLELATNLILLSLEKNSISDISSLAGLTHLTRLYLWQNSISDISAVLRLTNLILLDLSSNRVSDLSPLVANTGLATNLRSLSLEKNSISDISSLAGLTHLTRLYLWQNSISDISAVLRLTNLGYLDLTSNSVSDLSPLVANAGLGNGDTVDLWANPLSYAAIHTHIPALQSRGVKVVYENRAHPALLKISGDNQKGAALASLSQPFIVEAQDENGSTIAGISVTFAVTAGGGALSVISTMTNENGRARSSLILGPNLGPNTVEVSAAGIESTATFYTVADSELPPMTADVNSDGSVNVLDLIMIASSLGQAVQNDADVNGDGVVSVLDLVLVAGMFDGAASAPSAQPQVPETLTAVEVQGWLTDARSLEIRNAIMKRGIMVLEQLLVSLTPKETELLSNYPNPFNPETWIPYRLAEDAFVTLTIYDTAGQVVHALDVGHRIAAVYESRSRAIHWDGRNDLGEEVASGIYFYTLMAGDYSATRKMVILK